MRPRRPASVGAVGGHHSRLRAMVGEPEPQRTNNQAAVRRRETASTRLGFLPVAIGCGRPAGRPARPLDSAGQARAALRPVTQLSAISSLSKSLALAVGADGRGTVDWMGFHALVRARLVPVPCHARAT